KASMLLQGAIAVEVSGFAIDGINGDFPFAPVIQFQLVAACLKARAFGKLELSVPARPVDANIDGNSLRDRTAMTQDIAEEFHGLNPKWADRTILHIVIPGKSL